MTTKLSKKTKMFIAAAFVLGVAGTSAGVIHAATAASGSNGNPMTSLVSAIAAKFNLNVSDVQSVFDAQKAQMDIRRQQEFANRLSEAVTAGKLTQAQADAITAKQKEVQTFMEGLRDKTEAERGTAMKTEMDSLKQWATDNNISQEYLMFVGGHGGFGGRGFHGPRPHSVSNSTTTSSN